MSKTKKAPVMSIASVAIARKLEPAMQRFGGLGERWTPGGFPLYVFMQASRRGERFTGGAVMKTSYAGTDLAEHDSALTVTRRLRPGWGESDLARALHRDHLKIHGRVAQLRTAQPA